MITRRGGYPVRYAKPVALASLTRSAAAAYAPRELDDHSFGPEDIASMSAAFEAALGQLGLKERPHTLTRFVLLDPLNSKPPGGCVPSH
jgi:hypothetical protein